MGNGIDGSGTSSRNRKQAAARSAEHRRCPACRRKSVRVDPSIPALVGRLSRSERSPG
jgi:hypothetical protein